MSEYDLLVVKAIETHTFDLFKDLLAKLTFAEAFSQIKCVTRFPVHSLDFLETIVSHIYSKALVEPLLQPALAEMCRLFAERKTDWEFIQSPVHIEERGWFWQSSAGDVDLHGRNGLDKVGFASEEECLIAARAETSFQAILYKTMLGVLEMDSPLLGGGDEAILDAKTQEMINEFRSESKARMLNNAAFIGELVFRVNFCDDICLPAFSHLRSEAPAVEALLFRLPETNPFAMQARCLWDFGWDDLQKLDFALLQRLGALCGMQVDETSSGSTPLEAYLLQVKPKLALAFGDFELSYPELLQLAVAYVNGGEVEEYTFEDLLHVVCPPAEGNKVLGARGHHPAQCTRPNCVACIPIRNMEMSGATRDDAYYTYQCQVKSQFPQESGVEAMRKISAMANDVSSKWNEHRLAEIQTQRAFARRTLFQRYESFVVLSQPASAVLGEFPFEILAEVCFNPPLAEDKMVMMFRIAVEFYAKHRDTHTLQDLKMSWLHVRDVMSPSTTQSEMERIMLSPHKVAESTTTLTAFFVCDSLGNACLQDGGDEKDHLSVLFKYFSLHGLALKASGCKFFVHSPNGQVRHVVEVFVSSTAKDPTLPPVGFLIAKHGTAEEALNCAALELHCNNCGKQAAAAELHFCAGCRAVAYCNRKCQSHDWKHGGHKQVCHKS